MEDQVDKDTKTDNRSYEISRSKDANIQLRHSEWSMWVGLVYRIYIWVI